MSLLDDFARQTGMTRIALPGLDRPHHTNIVLGNGQIGHELKIICWGHGIVFLKCSEGGRLLEPYPMCKFCGHVFDAAGAKAQEIERQRAAGLVVDTDEVDAWPGLPAPLWASDGA